MKHLRSLLVAALAAPLFALAPGGANAAEVMPLSQENIQAAIAKSQPILYHVHAGWCPVCAKQDQVLDSLLKEPAFKDLVVFKVDFDVNKRAVETLQAKTQSTLVVARGGDEVGRSAGVTNVDQIRILLLKATEGTKR
jgi:thioredoxin 1